MIKAKVTMKDDQLDLALIEIENLEDSDDPDFGNYTIRFVVHTAAGYAAYQRSIRAFPRRKFNALALLRQALMTLEEEELSLDADPDDPRSSGNATIPRYLARGFD